MKYKKLIFLIIIMTLLIGCGGDDKKKNTETKQLFKTVENTEVNDDVVKSKRRDSVDNLPPELQGDAKKVKKVKTKLDAHKNRIDETIKKSDKLIRDLDKKIESTKK